MTYEVDAEEVCPDFANCQANAGFALQESARLSRIRKDLERRIAEVRSPPRSLIDIAAAPELERLYHEHFPEFVKKAPTDEA